MRKILSTFLVLWGSYALISGQELTQTVRGKITDSDSKQALIGAVIKIKESDPLRVTVTGKYGDFRFEKVTLGRIDLEISYLRQLGFIPNLMYKIYF